MFWPMKDSSVKLKYIEEFIPQKEKKYIQEFNNQISIRHMYV